VSLHTVSPKGRNTIRRDDDDEDCFLRAIPTKQRQGVAADLCM
jgi:hypothetical protein